MRITLSIGMKMWRVHVDLLRGGGASAGVVGTVDAVCHVGEGTAAMVEVISTSFIIKSCGGIIGVVVGCK